MELNTAILSIGVVIGVFIVNKLWSLKEDISDMKISLKEIEHQLINHVTDTDKKIGELQAQVGNLQKSIAKVTDWIDKQP